jgi:hypothetical protein
MTDLPPLDESTYEPSEQIYFGDPPALPARSTKGLPPERKRFAAYIAWRRKLADEITGLESAKAELEARISKSDADKEATERKVETAAGSLLGRIKAGLGFDLSQIEDEGRQAARDIAVSDGSLTVARAALAQIEPEISARTADLNSLNSRWNEFAGAALDEAARGLYQDYNEAVRLLIKQVAQLEGLLLAKGGRRPGALDIILPGYKGSGHIHLNQFPFPNRDKIDAAEAQWRSLAKAWEHDPCADAEKILKFN